MNSLDKSKTDRSDDHLKSKNNRVMAFSIGSITLFSASVLGVVGSISSLMIVSILASIGVSSIFHALLGGMEKGEINMKGPEALKNVSTNLKISGPIVAFLVVFFGVYYVGERANKIKIDNHDQIRKIFNKINIEPSNAIVLDATGEVTRDIKLSYELESGSLISSSKKFVDDNQINIFQELENNELNLKSKEPKDDFIIVHDKEIILGKINNQDVIQFLSYLAKNNSSDLKTIDSNSINQHIFQDCLNLEGVCKVPGIAKVVVNFSREIGEGEAKVCPNSEISSWLELSGSSLSFTKILNYPKGLIKAEKISEINEQNLCLQKKKNRVQLSLQHKKILLGEEEESSVNDVYVVFNPPGT